MKTDLSKKWNQAANSYANMAGDRKADGYEYDINFPSILNLIPKDKKSLLDVGTGSGDFISEASKYFSKIEGTDVSPNMVEIAKSRFPNYKFTVWDLEEGFPGRSRYDVIVCKMVLMFVDDLDNVAQEFKRILEINGSAIISVIHPTYWYKKYLLNNCQIESSPEFNSMSKEYYSTGDRITKEIGGDKNLQIEFIYRTLTDYLSPFIKAGMSITGIDEPKITPEFLKTNPRFSDRLNTPMRLNFRIQNTV